MPLSGRLGFYLIPKILSLATTTKGMVTDKDHNIRNELNVPLDKGSYQS